jgi:pimeloyl-ACP methyl ester carboxylesterase
MSEECGFLDRRGDEKIAWRRVQGVGPTVIWLGGFKSDMVGTKAQALADWAIAKGRSYIRFDYLGHGESSGEFTAGTISRWREDALAVVDELAVGPLILVGSSMGGWLSCLLAAVRKSRVQAMVLMAPAADFTEKLMAPEMTTEDRAAMAQSGIWMRPSDYGDPYPITQALLEDGARWSVVPGPVAVDCPVHVLQGGADPDVPWRHALALAEAFTGQDVVFTLIKDGDHRLSRPQDIARMIAAVEEHA